MLPAKLALPTFTKDKVGKPLYFQIDSIKISIENEGNQEHKIQRAKEGYMRIFVLKGDCNYSQISPECDEY